MQMEHNTNTKNCNDKSLCAKFNINDTDGEVEFPNHRHTTLITRDYKTRTVKGLHLGRMSSRECYVEVDHFSINGSQDIPRLNDFFPDALWAGAAQTRVFDKVFGIFFVRCCDEGYTEFPSSYRRWWELMVFLIHEDTGVFIDYALEDYIDIRHAILRCCLPSLCRHRISLHLHRFFDQQCPKYCSPNQDTDFLSLILEVRQFSNIVSSLLNNLRQVNTVSTFMANPTKDSLQVMYIMLTIFKYNINDGFLVPLLDDYMPKTSLVKSYCSTTAGVENPAFRNEIYSKHSLSPEHQCIVLLRIGIEKDAVSMFPGDETLARSIFHR